jgi:hypothetical protein
MTQKMSKEPWAQCLDSDESAYECLWQLRRTQPAAFDDFYFSCLRNSSQAQRCLHQMFPDYDRDLQQLVAAVEQCEAELREMDAAEAAALSAPLAFQNRLEEKEFQLLNDAEKAELLQRLAALRQLSDSDLLASVQLYCNLKKHVHHLYKSVPKFQPGVHVSPKQSDELLRILRRLWYRTKLILAQVKTELARRNPSRTVTCLR